MSCKRGEPRGESFEMFALSAVPTPSHPVVRSVSLSTRVLAKGTDFVFVIFLAAFGPYPIGPILALAYSLTCDGMNFGPFRGQSLGKKLFGLQVRNTLYRRPARVRESVLRNAPLGIAIFFSIIPVWGWIILALLGIPMVGMELYFMIQATYHGHRLGDVMGDTEVVRFREKETHV